LAALIILRATAKRTVGILNPQQHKCATVSRKQMKLSLIISFAFRFNACFCQAGAIHVVISNPDSSNINEAVFVDLKLGTQEISSGYQLFSKSFSFEKLVPGSYKITVHKIGSRLETYDNVQVRDIQTTDLAITYPPPCRFIYSDNYTPMCPLGHSDHIVPIVYGLPAKSTMDKSKKEKVHLGGCIVTGCDPRFYCTIHDREF